MAKIEIKPSKQLFTGNLIDGRSYLLCIEKHDINKFYWVEPHFKQLIDRVILNRSHPNLAILSKEDVRMLLSLAANKLVEFTIDDELFSNTTLNVTHEDEKETNSAEIANNFNALLYETNSPFSVKLELTTSCNLRCKYCYMQGAKNILVNSKQWIKVLERLRLLGVVQLDITGGEPLLYEGLSDIVQAADGMGFDTKIHTNGVLINRSFVDIIKKLRSVDICISFHSVDRDIFERFVQVKGVYSKIINSFEILSEARASFSAYIVLTAINEATIFDTIEYLEKAHIKFDISAFIFPNIYTISENHEYHPSSEIVAKLIKKGYLKEKKSKTKCTALKTKFWISSNGDILACEMYRHLKVGNIFETDIGRIWNSDTADSFRTHIAQRISQTSSSCSSCKHSSYCGYCPAFCEIYTYRI